MRTHLTVGPLPRGTTDRHFTSVAVLTTLHRKTSSLPATPLVLRPWHHPSALHPLGHFLGPLVQTLARLVADRQWSSCASGGRIGHDPIEQTRLGAGTAMSSRCVSRDRYQTFRCKHLEFGMSRRAFWLGIDDRTFGRSGAKTRLYKRHCSSQDHRGLYSMCYLVGLIVSTAGVSTPSIDPLCGRSTMYRG